MYNLTDYSLKDLRVIQAAIESKIQDLAEQIRLAHEYIPLDMHKDITRKDNKAMAILKEHNVHLLTAIQIVKEKETVNAN
jgi:hypothetical protein